MIKLLGHQDGQTVDGFAHIRTAGGKVDLSRDVPEKHYCRSNTASNLVKASSEKLSRISTESPPGRMTRIGSLAVCSILWLRGWNGTGTKIEVDSFDGENLLHQ